MADPTPFERLFDPDQQGTLTGFVGRAMGNNSVVGTARGNAMSELSKLQESGLTPQQSIVKFLQTPQGMEAFHSDPSFIQQAQEFVKAATPPNPQLHNVPEGNQVYATTPGQAGIAGTNPSRPKIESVAPGHRGVQVNSDNTTTDLGTQPFQTRIENVPPGNRGISVNGNNSTSDLGVTPPADVQSFTQMATIAGLDPKRLQEYAGNKIMIANRYEVKPIKNAWGEDTGGFVIEDKLTGNVVPSSKVLLPNGEVGDNPAAGSRRNNITNEPSSFAPGISNEQLSKATNADGTINAAKLYDDKRTMFLGSGVNAYMLNTLGQVMRNIDPSLTDEKSEKAVRQNDYIAQLQYELHNLVSNGGGLGIRSSVIKQASGLGPSENSWRDPKTAVTKGIQLYDLAQTEILRDKMIVNDLNGYPKEQRVDASKRIAQWEAVHATLPTRKEMVDLFNAFGSRQSGAVTGPDLVKSAGTMVKGGVSALGDTLSATTDKGAPQPNANAQPPAPTNVPPQAAPQQGQGQGQPPVKSQAAQQAPMTYDFSKMTDTDIIKINPAKLSPPEQQQYRARLDQLITDKQGQGGAPKNQGVPGAKPDAGRVKPIVGGQ